LTVAATKIGSRKRGKYNRVDSPVSEVKELEECLG
jgi:hypothetical protein